MAEQGHVGLDARCKRPRAVRRGAEQHRCHGVPVNHRKPGVGGLNEQASITVTVQCSTDQLTFRGRFQCMQEQVRGCLRFLVRPRGRGGEVARTAPFVQHGGGGTHFSACNTSITQETCQPCGAEAVGTVDEQRGGEPGRIGAVPRAEHGFELRPSLAEPRAVSGFTPVKPCFVGH